MTTNTERSAEATLATLLNSEMPPDDRRKLLIGLHAAQPAVATAVATALIERCHRQTDAIEELGEIITALKRMTQKLTSPAIRSGIFLGRVSLADGRTLARVVTGSQETFVAVLDDSLLDTLLAGDRIHLTAEGNVVIGKSDASDPDPGECATAERWLDASRLLLRHRDTTLVARVAAGLTPENVKTGDQVRLDPNSCIAMERVSADEDSTYAATADATSLPPEALAGCDDIRDATLRGITYAVAHPDIAMLYGVRKQRPWILLGGPPGVGKTTFARVIAGVLQRQTGEQCQIRKLNGAELLSPYVGETEQRIKALVRDIGRGDGWSILFIDEVDAIARTRGGSSNVHSDRFLSTWLSELEGFEGRARFILVAATNRLDMLDSAFRSRFSCEIQVPRPRMDAARAIFARHLAPDYPYYPNADGAQATRHTMIESAVAKLYLPNASGATIATLRFRDGKTRAVLVRDLMSGRLIEQICTEARERAFQRHVEGGDPGLCAEDLDVAIDAVRDRLRASLTPHNVHGYLTDLPSDLGVVAVDPVPRTRAGVTFIHRGAR